MAVEAAIRPNLEGTEPEVIYFGQIFYHHDVATGGLIIAKNLMWNQGDRGANVYVVPGFSSKPIEVDPDEAFDLAGKKYLYEHILPYFQTSIPTHLSNGDPTTLNLRHYPSQIPLFAYRSGLSQE